MSGAVAALLVHIIAGSTAMLCGAVALLSLKGGRTHRRFGAVFLAAMILIGLSAIVLTFFRPNLFLLFLALFALYLVIWGRLALTRKRLAPEQPAPRSHLLPTLLFGLSSLAFLAVAIRNGAPVFIVFVGLALLLVRGHLGRLRHGGEHRLHWLVDHVFGFAIAYVAGLTAVLVVNTTPHLPPTLPLLFLVWLGPTAVGVPLVIRYARKLRRTAEGAPTRGRAER
jgi:uncharacterized membrane protein